MVLKKLLYCQLIALGFSLNSNAVFAQSNEEIKDTSSTVKSAPVPPLAFTPDSSQVKKKSMLPELGFGPGLLTYFGDYKRNKSGQPIRYRIGYSFIVQKNIIPTLDVTANLLLGSLYGNQRDVSGNYNFKSKSLTAGIGVVYNFFEPFYKNLKKPPILTPFVGVGVEFFHFKTSTDATDKNGKPYYYWNDGSIHDMNETDPASVYARNIFRDYTYETSLTKGNTVSFPVTAGVRFHVSERISFNISATLHNTLTDNIDNIKAGKKDKFLFSAVTLNYNFGASPYKNLYDGEDRYANVEFIDLEKVDADGDGVKDLIDNCPETPSGVLVDAYGCPLDDDKDGVPNYVDMEANTKLGAQVDAHGVEITDEYIARKNKEEEDFLKTGDAPEIVNSTTYSGDADPTSLVTKLYYDQANKDGVSFMVQLGSYKDGIPSDQVESFMRIQDLKTKQDRNGNTIYLAGMYGNVLAAQSRRDELKNAGVKNPIVVAQDAQGNFVNPGKMEEIPFISNTGGAPVITPHSSAPAPAPFMSTTASYEIIFKVQIGAFSQNVPSSKLTGLEQVSKESGPNGLTRILSGSYPNYRDAVAYQNRLRAKGYPEAFVVAYKDGKRVGLSQAKGEMPASESKENRSGGTKPVFKIQIGIFKSEATGATEKLFSSLKNLDKTKTPAGLIKYTAGSFSTYEEALKYKEELAAKGINGAFVISFIEGKQVSLSEAMKQGK